MGRNNNGNDKWINFNICNDQYPLPESCGGDGTDCLLDPDKFLVIYEGAGHIGEDWGGMAGNPECYIDPDTRGFNDQNQPANIINNCEDFDCSHMDGDEDVIAIFSSDPTCGSNGRWDGHRETDCGADLVDLAEWFDDSNGEYDDAWDINSSKSISLISPDCDNNGIYIC